MGLKEISSEVSADKEEKKLHKLCGRLHFGKMALNTSCRMAATR